MSTERLTGLALRFTGAGLLAAAGAIHLDLYLTGYRTIPTIGWLFLLQVIAAFALAAVIAASGSRMAEAAGAVFAVATLGGYLLSVWVGLFGFTEVRTTAGIAAGVIEVAAFGVLAWACADGQPRMVRTTRLGTLAAGVGALGILLGAVATAGGAAGTGYAAHTVDVGTVGGVRVLTDSRGFTLYWFAIDTPTTSRCTGSCTAYWPPVIGPVHRGPGLVGNLGTISRPDGSLQATYDGHPLYTYISDKAPGQARGNKLNLNGGVWHEVVVGG